MCNDRITICLDKYSRLRESAVSKWLGGDWPLVLSALNSNLKAYIFLLRPSPPSSLLYPPHHCWFPGKWQRSGSEPAAAPRDSPLCALSSWWTWTAVGSGQVGWRARCSAVLNKWSGYPITSWSTSVRQKDMARCKINRYHLATAVSSIVRTPSCWKEEDGSHSSVQVPDTWWYGRPM